MSLTENLLPHDDDPDGSKAHWRETMEDLKERTLARQALRIQQLEEERGRCLEMAKIIHGCLFGIGGFLNDPPFEIPDRARRLIAEIDSALHLAPEPEDPPTLNTP